MSDIQRFDVPTKDTLIEGFLAFRDYLEKAFAAKGQKLDPAWYDISPERVPHLYADQPHLLKKGTSDDIRPT